MAQSLNEALASHAPVSSAPGVEDGQQLQVPLELLDPNPFQPRTTLDAAQLEELKASIRAQGLIQPIAVRPRSDGRYTTVAGHRRVEAFRQLQAEAAAGEGGRYATIPGVVKLAIDDGRLAAMAFIENKARADLTLVEEGRALNRMVEAGLASSNDELAALTGQPVRSIYRLRRLVKAPRFLLGAVEAGVMVVVGTDEEGKERKELRRLELMAALAFLTLHEHLVKVKPKAADERTEGAVRRALAGNWSLRRVEEYVQDIRDGRRAEAEADVATPEGQGGGEDAPALFALTPKRFVVERSRLKGASGAQLAALKAAFVELVGSPKGEG